MSLPSISRTSPFTRAVVQAMRKLYPESLADKSFDNTGLLLEAPFTAANSDSNSNNNKRQKNSVLLAVDLTRAVADEAIARRDSVVVAYHPIIFRGLKAVTLADSQQQSLLRLACAGISVYSPHTAVDAAPGGLGDWLADIVTGARPGPSSTTTTAGDRKETTGTAASVSKRPAGVQRTYSTPSYPTNSPKGTEGQAGSESEGKKGTITHSRSVLQASPSPPAGFEAAGMGRLVTFKEAQALGSLVDRIARGVGSPKGFPVAVPQGCRADELSIRTVAVCAGSGGGVFRGVDADLFFTGELSHHEALAITERGAAVVTLFHSNSERGFLHDVLRTQLASAVADEWEAVRREERQAGVEYKGSEWAQLLDDDSIQVDVSEQDRDPYGIVVLQED